MLLPGTIAPRIQRRPVSGRPIDSEEVLDRRPIAIVFLRYAGSAHTRAAALALDEAWDALDPDVLLVGVTEGSAKAVNDFVPRYKLRFPVLHDADGTLYAAYGVGTGGLWRALGGIARYPKVLEAGRGWPEGPLGRTAAAFVIGRDGRIAWSWYGKAATDLPPVATLVTEARGAVGGTPTATRSGVVGGTPEGSTR